MEKNSSNSNQPVHSLDVAVSEEISSSKIIGIFLLLAILGGVTGFILSYLSNSTALGKKISGSSAGKVARIAGIKDKKTFKDSATGILQEGGVDGEGSYHLERPGGESQNVYLTSSAVDLSGYVGKKVTVSGETFAAEKAGWLMDVGLVEVAQ